MIEKIQVKLFEKKYIEESRKRLNNHNFTILCSNCLGGIVYHHLGERFCSPTINLWMSEIDFQKYCLNLNYYSKCDLKFIESKKKYPVATLGEEESITIYFQHYKSQKEAEEKWRERTKRIDVNNLYVIAADNGMSKEQLCKWQDMKCKNMVIFTGQRQIELPYTFLLKKYEQDGCVGKYVNDVDYHTGLRYVETVFDFVNFVNK